MVEEILKKLIAFKSVTPNECGAYAYICNLLGQEWKRIEVQKEGVKNLFLYRDFAPEQKSKIHFCFAGHIDVVPAGEGWKFDPFEGASEEGFIYGRGAQDMKGGIGAFLSALLQAEPKNCLVSVLLTSDEEGEGICGTRLMLEELKQRHLLPDYCIVAEPTSENKIADCIKVGRRGSVNGVIVIEGKQGHIAYPQKCINPVELLGVRLGEIAGKRLDEGDEFFEPSQIVVADIRGGMEVCNVTPASLKIMLNVRHSTKITTKDIESYLRSVLEGLPFKLEIKESSKPFLTSSKSALVDWVCESVQNVVGYLPKLSTSGGTSDARFFASYGVEVVELGVLNDRIHAKDERVSVAELEALQKIFVNFLSRF